MDEKAASLDALVPALRRYAVALLRDREAADDLVQDCLERAVSRWTLRRRDGDLRAWLFTILHNRFLDIVRRRRREGIWVALDDAPDLPSVVAAAEGRLALGDVLTALNRLDTEDRAVILLVAIEDLSYDEAARVLGVPVGTIMSRLSRARGRLRRGLDGGAVPALRVVR